MFVKESPFSHTKKVLVQLDMDHTLNSDEISITSNFSAAKDLKNVEYHIH
jgi:hypothetical protein